MADRRKSRRFEINQPAVIRLADGEELRLTASNVSLEGALLVAATAIPYDTEVEVVILLQNDLQTSCLGRVVRIEMREADSAFGIAIECSRQFSEAKPTRLSSKICAS